MTRPCAALGLTIFTITVGLAFTGANITRVSADPDAFATGVRHASSTVATSARGPLTALRRHWPVHGPVNSEFGARRSSWWRRQVHAGVDIGARRGTPVRAPAAGSVVFVGWRPGYGRTIILDHGQGVQSLYAHLSKFGVTRGQRLEQGVTIGLTGASGNASGSHLHYEVHVKGRPVNPRGSHIWRRPRDARP